LAQAIVSTRVVPVILGLLDSSHRVGFFHRLVFAHADSRK
jgi:hypothetical protein